LSHVDGDGRARMVDVTEKAPTVREARAMARVLMEKETFHAVLSGRTAKGPVLETARIAGIQAAKRTAFLIPLCHPIALTHVSVDFYPEEPSHAIRIETAARATGPTGVEMEALTAAAVAGLTIYDMAKAMDRGMRVTDVLLLAKSGGKSGEWSAKTESVVRSP